jgi:hypothetical protein
MDKMNTIELVRKVMSDLDSYGISTQLGGGWAEELQGLMEKRAHKDIDLFYIGTTLDLVDSYMSMSGYTEITAKHLPHKRAYLVDGTMVEIILIQTDKTGCYISFYNNKKYYFPDIVHTMYAGLNCLTIKNLNYFRAIHDEEFLELQQANYDLYHVASQEAV